MARETPQGLLELCEPLFLYVCRLNRSARKGGEPDPTPVRTQIEGLFEQMSSRAESDPNLALQYEQVELPLIFFVDFMIKESNLQLAQSWQELAYARNELAGDEKFFDLLEETLVDSGNAATERLAVFYVCMGLGFTGWYTGQPEFIKKKMAECAGRLRKSMDVNEAALICPEAYEHVNTSDLVEPPGKKLAGIGVVLLGLAVVLVIANFLMFSWTSGDIKRSLEAILTHQTHSLNAEAAPPR